MPLDLFYTMVQKRQKWPKTQIKGGSCQGKGVDMGVDGKKCVANLQREVSF